MSGTEAARIETKEGIALAHHRGRADVDRVVMLALLVVRAGARDSLGWWEDEALTEAGAFALRRIFPRDPKRVAIRLAFRAAGERHTRALEGAGISQAVTLLDLTEAFVEATVPIPVALDERIASPDELRRRMIELAPQVNDFRVPEPDALGLLDLSALVEQSDFMADHGTALLAAGYLTAQWGKPVYPYIRGLHEGPG